jgi:hypothetical protein
MSEPHETILGRTSNGPLRGTPTGHGVPGSDGRMREDWPDLSVDRAWGPVPRSYDWFGELDPDGLPDGCDFLDRPSDPTKKQESP